MEEEYLPVAEGLFVILVAALLVLILKGLDQVLQQTPLSPSKRKLRVLATGGCLAIWLGFLAVMAAQGFFMEFTLPPRFAIAVLPPIVFIILLLLSKKVGVLLDLTPPAWLVYIQSFRIWMEIILWMMYVATVLPVQLTFEGRNWDILAGITAVIVGYFCFTRKRWSHRVVFWWNLFGLALLFNVVITGILSAPFPFRVFMNEPANTIMGHFPFVWLPGFVVPVAMCMHVLSIRQLLRKSDN